MSKNRLINCDNLNITYGNSNILSDISFDINEGEIVTIIGPNGSGKSTLIKAICGIIPKYNGKVTLRDGLKIGYMPQKITIDKVMPLTVRRFLRLNASHLRDRSQIEKIAKELDIEPLLQQQVHDLSGGQMQRVLLSRALLLNPDILILDEPTQGLDINGQAEFYRLISNISKQKKCAVLMVSHDLHTVMAQTDRVICINHHICCHGSPTDVSNDPEYIALFGKNAVKEMAIYTHHHDHTHSIDGQCQSGDDK